MPVPPEAADTRFAFLPPMSGLAATEPKWAGGRIHVLLGEGQTAQVPPNLCYQLCEQPGCGEINRLSLGRPARPTLSEPLRRQQTVPEA
jgi:hypothetical protein